MRIGVVSDTHNNMKNVAKIVELFNSAGVERVIHTGDITQAKTIEAFSQLHMSMYGVFGNNDQERETLGQAISECGFLFCEPPYIDVWAGREIIVVHDPLEFESHLCARHELALHGHTHRYRLEQLSADASQPQSMTTVFNPGECAGHMPGHNAVGVVDLISLETELLKF